MEGIKSKRRDGNLVKKGEFQSLFKKTKLPKGIKFKGNTIRCFDYPTLSQIKNWLDSEEVAYSISWDAYDIQLVFIKETPKNVQIEIPKS